ncbi:MAG: hypothetical protein NZM06_11445 [Chloroherpetonaceae bacterium]|nr:hypothetical protein [Chloroherpetonaceae bacterium]MDW8438305.1 hypothetical protein [Chloroherpetonaceae bacterium]
MPKRAASILPLLVALAFSLAGAGCKKSERSQRDIDSLFSAAQSQKASGDVWLAIESFQRLAEMDSLRRTAHRLELAALYDLAGDFRNAFLELEKLPPHDSLETRKLALLQRLNDDDALRQRLRRKFPLSPSDELLLGDLSMRDQDYDRACYHFSLARQSDDLLVSVRALGRLAALFEGYRQNGADSSDFFLREISNALAHRRLSSLPLEAQFQILCESACVFAESESFAPKADSLFSRAQTLLKNPAWRGGSSETLSAWLDLWRSAVSNPQSELIERRLALFQQKEHRLGEAFATLLLGECDALAPSRRIEILKIALERFESLAYVALPYRIEQEMAKGFGELIALLLEQERALEAFEISERVKALEQKFSPLRRVKNVSQAFQDLARLRNDIAAICEAKDSLAFLPDDAKRLERSQLLGETLAQKQGEFYQKSLELKAQRPSEAESLSPSPITLAETESLLSDGEALLQLAFGEKASFAIVIESGAIRVVKLSLARPELKQALKRLRFELLNGLPLDSLDALGNPTRRALSKSVFDPLRALVEGKSRLYVVSNEPFPIHLLGEEKLLAQTHLISSLSSARQLRIADSAWAVGALRVISPNDLNDLPFLEARREALIEWGRLDENAKALCATWQASLVEAYRRYAISEAEQNRYGWINFSCYGKSVQARDR